MPTAKEKKAFKEKWEAMDELERAKFIASAPVSIKYPTMSTSGEIGYAAYAEADVPLSLTPICDRQSKALQKAADFVRRMEEKLEETGELKESAL